VDRLHTIARYIAAWAALTIITLAVIVILKG
jgi:hypothetical protein